YYESLTEQHPDAHTVPTRRSSDLLDGRGEQEVGDHSGDAIALLPEEASKPATLRFNLTDGPVRRPLRLDEDEVRPLGVLVADERSEEHTSELQSPDHLVCRLLLVK